MNKKGFTLAELLGVIVILGLLLAMLTPVVSSVIKNSKSKSYENQKKILIETARLWTSENSNYLSDEINSIYYLSTERLKQSGFLNNQDLYNLNNNTILNNSCVAITTNANKYSYEFIENCSQYLD